MEENGTSKFKKYLYNEVALVMAIAGVLWGIYNYTTNPIHSFDLQIQEISIEYENLSKQMANIKDNDLHTLELQMDEIKKQQVDILQAIARMETILKMDKQFLGGRNENILLQRETDNYPFSKSDKLLPEEKVSSFDGGKKMGWFEKHAQEAREIICPQCGRVRKASEWKVITEADKESLRVIGVKFLNVLCEDCKTAQAERTKKTFRHFAKGVLNEPPYSLPFWFSYSPRG